MEYVQKKMHMKERERILNKHLYKIWQGKDGKWYTHVPDNNKKEKRRLIKRNTREKIEEVILELYKNENALTVKDVFEEAKDYAVNKKNRKKSTITVYQNTYNKYLTQFGKRKIQCLVCEDVEKLYNSVLEQYGKISQSQYNKLNDLMKVIFKYAKRKKYISWRIEDVLAELDSEIYKQRSQYKDTSELVFMETEIYMLNEFWKRNPDTKNLALAVIAGTGLRPGEVVAIRKEAVHGSVITVKKCEMKYEINGMTHYEIQDTTKTPAGYRNVVCFPEYQWALDMLMEKAGVDGWLCLEKGQLLNTKNLRDRLYYICNRKLHILPRSTDKLRKTFATYLSELGAEDRDIIAQMGHTNIGVTNDHYIKNRKPAQDRLQRFIDLKNKAV